MRTTTITCDACGTPVDETDIVTFRLNTVEQRPDVAAILAGNGPVTDAIRRLAERREYRSHDLHPACFQLHFAAVFAHLGRGGEP